MTAISEDSSGGRSGRNTTSHARESRFDWPLCDEAEEFVLSQIRTFCERNFATARFAERLTSETSTLLIDWVDHLVLAAGAETPLLKNGFVPDPLGDTPATNQTAFWHPEAILPRFMVDKAAPDNGSPLSLAIRADSLQAFMAAHHLEADPEGEPFTRFRRATISAENGTHFEVVERCGYRGHSLERSVPGQKERFHEARQLWKNRRRVFDDDAEGFRHTHTLLDRVIREVGRDVACHIIFGEERAYWQQRNRAAQIQKRRQDSLGLGWANHDHHTFRSSRAHFLDLMLALQKLGFERRERYYAGAQAGWGAQILEHPVEGIVTFCDVDLEPEETQIDFSRRGLPAANQLGTIGLWVGLHGESFLQAGMHHLECRFDFNLLRNQLLTEGVGTMKPFSNFSFLKQAFTEGERWTIDRRRAERLLRAGFIDEVQFKRFLDEGAVGSHLENLQRKGGFKGFNQTSVSAIIRETDPRSQSRGA